MIQERKGKITSIFL